VHRHRNHVCESIVVAVGTVDGKKLSRSHFGDSPYFAVYRVSRDGWKLLELRPNKASQVEEEKHGDPRKFRAVARQLDGIDVAAAWAMGPNYVRMRDESPIVPYVFRGEARRSLLVEDGLRELVENFDELCRAVERKRG